MKISTTTIFLTAASFTLSGACPGSPARTHAKCDMGVTFTSSCEAVLTEINARVAGKNGWSDPHNNGHYSIKNQTNSYLSGQRITGDNKYTDFFDFSFTPTAAKGCTVEACSESQVNSLIDYSTNYCNLHSLYCSAASGCPTVGADLSYSEVYKSCSQHDNVCVVTKDKYQATVKVDGRLQCAADIKSAAASLNEAGHKIADMGKDCADGFTAACNNDIQAVLVALDAAGASITAAVYDCGGNEESQCAKDINKIISDITSLTNKILDSVIDCQSSKDKCMDDISAARKSIATLLGDIRTTAKDCRARYDFKVKDHQQCANDIKDAASSLVLSGRKIADAKSDCADGFTASCNNDIQAVLEALGAAGASITAAVYDCGGNEESQCAKDINKILSDITTVTEAIMDATIDCQSSKDKCMDDISAGREGVTSMIRSIHSAAQDC